MRTLPECMNGVHDTIRLINCAREGITYERLQYAK